VKPPPEIGRVLSIHSTLATNVNPWSLFKRFLLGLAFAVGFVAAYLTVIVLVDINTHRRWVYMKDGIIIYGISSAIAVAGIVLGVMFSRFRHFCCYVGTEGAAHFQCSGRRDRLTIRKIFLYDKANELRVRTINHYTNHVYECTKYKFTW